MNHARIILVSYGWMFLCVFFFSVVNSDFKCVLMCQLAYSMQRMQRWVFSLHVEPFSSCTFKVGPVLVVGSVGLLEGTGFVLFSFLVVILFK